MILCICMTVTALPNGVFAAEGAVKEVSTKVIVDTSKSIDKSKPISGGDVSTQGVKSKAIKIAVKKLAGMLRSRAVNKVADFMETYVSKQASKTLKKYAGQIANKLDELATWEDLALQAIADQVKNLLIGFGVSSSIAEKIGLGLKWFVEWFLL